MGHILIKDHKPEDTLSLRARFVINELKRLSSAIGPEDLPEFTEEEVPGLDEAIQEYISACEEAKAEIALIKSQALLKA